MSKKKDHTKVTFQLFVIFYQPDSRLDCVIYRHQVVTSQEVQWPRWRLQDTGGYRCYRDGPEPVNTVLLCAVFNSLIAARSLHVLTESIFFPPKKKYVLSRSCQVNPSLCLPLFHWVVISTTILSLIMFILKFDLITLQLYIFMVFKPFCWHVQRTPLGVANSLNFLPIGAFTRL